MEPDDSFARLVHSANPASSSRYPPRTTRTTTAMDPFFDDDDDLLDQTQHQFPMRSQESGLPFAHDAAAPAGFGNSSTSLSRTGHPQGWSEDAFQGSASFPGAQPTPKPPPKRRRKKWRWPWEKQVVPTGERIIVLNNPAMNDDFGDNFVSTSKYNPVIFIPKFLKGMSLSRSHLLPLTCSHRAILQIRKYLLPLHFLHPADTQRLTHKPVHHHRPSRRRTPRFRIQRDPRRSRQSPYHLISPCLSSPFRNDTNLTPSSTPASQRYSRPHPPLNYADGETFVSATSFVSSQTSSSPQISFSYPRPNQRVSASSKHPTSTGTPLSILCA